MEASGDLRGMVTLMLKRDAANNTVTGEWAFVNSYVQDLGEGHSHQDGHNHLTESNSETGEHGERLIDKGTIRGKVTGGGVTLNNDGTLSSLNSIQLNIISGSLTYTNVKQGNGAVNGLNLSNLRASTGTMTLTFSQH
jgi:hypothetical protein